MKKRVETELTFEKLKTYSGFENTTEEESIKQIDAIKRLAKVLYYMYLQEEEQDKKEK
ncbi:MAG: hypothetical protein WAQ28_21040 [Bacteroidia bacterium]